MPDDVIQPPTGRLPAMQQAWRRPLGVVLILAVTTAAGARWASLHGRPPSLDMWRSLVLDIGICVTTSVLIVPQKRPKVQTVVSVTGALIASLSLLVGRL